MSKHRNHDARFKARVALGAVKGERTVSELAREYGVHPTMIHHGSEPLAAQSGESRADTTAEAETRRDETKMHCVKLLGQGLMARDFDRQVAELQIRAAVLNGYTALGIPVTETVG